MQWLFRVLSCAFIELFDYNECVKGKGSCLALWCMGFDESMKMCNSLWETLPEYILGSGRLGPMSVGQEKVLKIGSQVIECVNLVGNWDFEGEERAFSLSIGSSADKVCIFIFGVIFLSLRG